MSKNSAENEGFMQQAKIFEKVGQPFHRGKNLNATHNSNLKGGKRDFIYIYI